MIERTCAECGATLTSEEIRGAIESNSPFLCTVHAIENVPLAEEQEEAEG